MRLLHFLKKLSSIATPDETSDDEFELLEFIMVTLYSKTCNTKEVNEARWILLSRDNKVIENIPLTKEALIQLAPRSILQSSKWLHSFSKLENEMIPLWTDLPQTSNVCREHIKCGCKKGCTGRCKCLTSDLKCSELCQCFGKCTNGKSC